MQNDKTNSYQSGMKQRVMSVIIIGLLFFYHILSAQIDYQIVGTWYAYGEKVEISEEGCLFKSQLYSCSAHNNIILLTTPQCEVISIQYKLIGDELHLQARGFSLVLYKDENAVPYIETPFEIPSSN